MTTQAFNAGVGSTMPLRLEVSTAFCWTPLVLSGQNCGIPSGNQLREKGENHRTKWGNIPMRHRTKMDSDPKTWQFLWLNKHLLKILPIRFLCVSQHTQLDFPALCFPILNPTRGIWNILKHHFFARPSEPEHGLLQRYQTIQKKKTKIVMK